MSGRKRDPQPRCEPDPETKPKTLHEHIEAVENRALKRAAQLHIERLCRLDMSTVCSFHTLASLQFGQMLLAAALVPQGGKMAATCAEMRKCLEGMQKNVALYLETTFPDEVQSLVEAALKRQQEAFESVLTPEQIETFRRRLLEAPEETD